MTPATSRRRSLSVDFLEGRALLNAGRPQAPAAEVRIADVAGPLQITLTGSNRYISDYFIPTSNPYNPVQASIYDINARGRAGKLGQFRLQASYNTGSDGADGYQAFAIWQGTGTLSDSKGDQLSLTFSGVSAPRRGKYLYNLTGAVVEGTGSFANTTGTLTATGRELPHAKIQLHLTVNPS